MSGTTVIKLAFKQEWKVLSIALKSDPTFEMEEIATANEAATFLSTVSSALILISLANKEDFIQMASLMKIYKKVAPDTAVKLSVINFSGDRNYEKAIAKLGIQDIIDPNINTKALRFKIDFWMKGLNVQIKKNEAALAVRTTGNSAEAGKSGQKSPDASGINWVEPMDCVDDFWLIKNEGDCKRILGKWLIRITGPGPYVAQWTEVNGQNNLWKFEFRNEERENFFDSDGNWFLKNDQRPDFQWKENAWIITGNQFELYYQDKKNLINRISFGNKILTITKNSEFARTKETMVLDSFDKEIVLKRNGNILSNEAVDTEGGTDKFKNLDGKGKTDKTSSGPLSGKTKNVDDLSSGLLALDLEPGGNKLNDGTMSGPASGKVAQGPELSLENKSNEHKTHWKGHNEAEKFEAAPEKERKNYEADRQNNFQGHLDHEKESSKEGDFGGKGSTDKLNKFYGNGEKDPSTGSETSENGSVPLKAERTGKKANLETEVSDFERGRELKRQKKEAIEAKQSGIHSEEDVSDEDDSRKEQEGNENVASLEEARKVKELQRTLGDENDRDLDEAMQNLEIMSFLLLNNEKVSCKLDDFYDQTLIFSVVGKATINISEVEMDLNFSYLKKMAKLQFKGTVTETIDDGEGNMFISVQIPAKSMGALGAFMKLYQVRQKNINFFLQKVKGV